jgi:UDP-N-acetylglucosamine kinase
MCDIAEDVAITQAVAAAEASANTSGASSTSIGSKAQPKFDEKIAKDMLDLGRLRVNLAEVQPSENKHLVILGGQPAAGKSSITKELFDQHKGNIVLLNGDEFKPLYPNYKELARLDPDGTSKLVQPYSNYVIDNLKQEAIDRGLNVIVEGTMRTSEVPLKTADEFASKGYTVEAYVVASNYYNSRIGIEQRYENEVAEQGFGRMVNPINHDEAYRNIPGTIQDLVDSKKFTDITIATRDGAEIAKLSRGDDVTKEYTNLRNDLSAQVYADVNNRINDVNTMLSNRNATPAEFDNISSIKSAIDNDYSKQLANTQAVEKSATFTFEKGTKTDEVLKFYEKFVPETVAQIKQDHKIEYNGTSFNTDNMRPQLMATILKDAAAKENIDIKIEKSIELSKGFER